MHSAPASAITDAGAANIRLWIAASSNTSVGLQIFANANVQGSGAAPTGTMTFKAFGPDDASCSTGIFTSTVAVVGNSTNSARFTPAHAGVYRWQATYSGDPTDVAAGPTACNDPAGDVVVDKASAYVTAAAAAPGPTTMHGTVSLTNGSNPTGAVTFLLTGPNDLFCSTTPVFTSTVAVNGNGTYDSGTFSPARSGKYTWRASYGGDADNLGTPVTPCINSSAAQTITAGPPPGAFDGTAKTQLAVFRPATGMWYIEAAGGGNVRQVAWGQAGDIPVADDYNGDGKTDIAVYRPSTGQWLVKGISETVYGAPTDIPVPGDYDGDGRADRAVYRPSTGQWLVKGVGETVYGAPTDIPVPGDYNADGKNDVAVYRPSTGQWLVKGISETVYGAPTDLPVPGDYDGDGRTDIAVFRPASGQWLVKGISETVYGGLTDLPIPGDYDGEGRTDVAVWRPTNGTWYVKGILERALGQAGDIPAG
jgi:hypothetical protein